MFAPIETILAEFDAGRMVVLVDDESEASEGAVIFPADRVDADVIAFMARYARGLVCLAITSERALDLELQPMSRRGARSNNQAFTVSIEAREGVSTGISAADRARTIQVAIDPRHGRDDLVTPGHVFPMVAQSGGVLARAGHTEAAVDLSRLVKRIPAGVICKIMGEHGNMALLPELAVFARHHELKIGSIADLVAYRRRTERLVTCVGSHSLESAHGGDWTVNVYRNGLEEIDTLALVKGRTGPGCATPVCLHLTTIFDDVLGRVGAHTHQLQAIMREIGGEERGVIVILRHTRSSAFADVLEAESALSGDYLSQRRDALREYGIGAQILADLGARDLILYTGSAAETSTGLEGYGLNIVEYRPLPRELESRHGFA